MTFCTMLEMKLEINFMAGNPLTEEEQVFLCVIELDDNVNQDGVDCYIMNMYSRKFFPEYFKTTVEALKKIGAMTVERCVKEVYERYSDMEEYDIDRTEKDRDFTDAFDSWFYQYKENLVNLEYQYILNHLI